MERCPSQAQSLGNPVLGDAKAVHTEYLDVHAQLLQLEKHGYAQHVVKWKVAGNTLIDVVIDIFYC
ncbi:MAG: hypothetical protein KKE12_01505 [Proteobacteria bacterium]|nr:hypothetical protein [Pseudomonadota bacterium]